MADDLDRLKAALADRYAIEREIGAGGMATVYLAQDLRHNRKVAVKVLRSDLAASLGSERFLREVQVTANLQHPHILPLYDSGEADGFLFYVMPFIEGESLRDRLVRERELPVTDAARLLRDVVDALTAAHKLGVVHRDIKPENVLLSGRHAMVSDFGVAKAVSEATGRHQLTTLGVALGTPSYMAPEQAAADEKIDHRADIYAVGALAYELLTGRPPFTGGTPQQILASQVVDQPKPVSELRPAVPPALETLVMRCLEKKPADRWQTAEEMLPHLEAAATPSGGMTPTGLTPVKRAAPLWKRPVVGIGVAALAVIAALLGYWGLRSGAPDAGLSEATSASASAYHPRDSLLVVVLPFENRTGDAEQDVVGELVAEWTAGTLDRSGAFPVVPSSSVRDLLRGAGEASLGSIVELGRRTGARYALAGSYSILGATIRFESELLDLEDGSLVGTLNPLTGSVDSVEVTLNEAAQAFTAGVVAYLTPGLMVDLQSLPPNLQAFQAYQAGNEAFCVGRYAEAADKYREAMALAPEWPSPRLALFPTLGNLGRSEERAQLMEETRPMVSTFSPAEKLHWTASTFRPTPLWEAFKAREALFQRDPSYGYPMAYLAVQLNFLQRAREGVMAIDFDNPCTRTWGAAWVLTTQVLHLLGENETALERVMGGRRRFPAFGTLVVWEGRIRAALGEVERVRQLADTLQNLPLDPTTITSNLMEMGLAVWRHQSRDSARPILEDALEWTEAHPDVDPFQHARLLYYLGRYEDALPILEDLAAERGRSQDLGYQALTLDGLGRTAEADSVIALFDEFPRARYPALLAARRGLVERAVQLLRANVDAGMPYYAYNQVNLLRDPDLEPIRAHPLFQALMRPSG